MKAVTFYAEYMNKADKRASRNPFRVLARVSPWEHQRHGIFADAIVNESGGYTSTRIEQGYTRTYCTRISEETALLIDSGIFNCGLL